MMASSTRCRVFSPHIYLPSHPVTPTAPTPPPYSMTLSPIRQPLVPPHCRIHDLQFPLLICTRIVCPRAESDKMYTRASTYGLCRCSLYFDPIPRGDDERALTSGVYLECRLSDNTDQPGPLPYSLPGIRSSRAGPGRGRNAGVLCFSL